MDYEFKKGVYRLNGQSNLDFQLNRTVMWDGGALREIQGVGPGTKTSEVSEFFTYDGDPGKKNYYEKI